MTTYSPPNTTFVRGDGVYLFDEVGKKYLDFTSGIAVLSLGHCHPHLVKCLEEQAKTLWHTSNMFRVPAQELLAQRLTQNSFAESVFFANSGTEAVECGLKLIRKHFFSSGSKERYRIITFEGGFHGRTFGSMAAGNNNKYLSGFEPTLSGFDQVPFADLDAVRSAISSETAAIFVEPIQGEAGVRVFPSGFLGELRAICDENGLLLFLDEVQTGIGRTGRLFAYEWEDITPDIVAIAKGLGGGFPIGACLSTKSASTGMVPGSHGSTFGGNPLAMTVGNAVLDIVLSDGFLNNVQEVGRVLESNLLALQEDYPHIFGEVRGKGLLMGISCINDNSKIISDLREKGLLVARAGENVIRILPPLISEESHIDEAINLLSKIEGL